MNSATGEYNQGDKMLEELKLIITVLRAFYALLATDIGQEIAMFLSRHKRSRDFGHRVIRRVSIFAADSNKSVNTPLGTQSLLIKWPVLIWEVVPFNEEYVAQARALEGAFLDDDRVHKRGPDGEALFPFMAACRLAEDSPKDIPRICLPDAELHVSRQTPGNMVFQ
jgi:hypothetical protein